MLVEFLLLFLSLLFTMIGSMTFWRVHEPLDFYKPLVLFIGGYLISMIFTWTIFELTTLTIKKDKVYEKPNRFSRLVFNSALSYVDLHALIKLKVNGLYKVPKNERYLLVCNHRSNFDSMIVSKVLKRHYIAFIAKESLFKIPIGGKHMRRLCYLSIDRTDNLQSLAVMKKAEEYIENNATSIGVFPEGKRQQEKTIGDFHEGVFNIAIKSQCPIVICTLKGTQDIKTNFPFKRTAVTLDFIETLNYEDYGGFNAKQLSDIVQDKMIQNLC